ncbi:formyltetrahydrofolate deformylase [Mucilaginibacter phyllosphaerae]|uniref:Formyltetrahydrofolate deformylase n=1 Tax=Mucilaginibacter phyllosphaerae TaxID=1812349 RepID=A0A4Y8AGG2_9SPHI|nr:formyltetrahydrofolate deformylase [Mucilaginibacter phyllosphaerae]MBB3968520.1 formyltetrahydrofolate deformylase [Mucilaginibacter phyllosphaerae]TEW67837.1 formyltetrahydrofolate deformylase [Mucilaginibacter phyllosphaerae]GGH15510.1 formyltetrahydrofolate deformylase [Mucilaginibacter phyllosphaerae]
MIIVIQCTDRVGLVAAISGLLAQKQFNIISMHEHVDNTANLFFMRLEVDKTIDDERIEDDLRDILPNNAIIKINPAAQKKIIVLVTKEYHCLADILVRNYFNTLGASVQCVIGNHETLQDICKRFDVPFFYVEAGNDKAEFEQQVINTIQNHDYDYLVLAKFMRILSHDFVSRFPMQIINIHHSFLPAFAGASPYRQAYERGVKLIGATAHYVTDELDEGPIIAQQIIPANHSLTVADMVKAGKEIETAVLAKALKLVFDDRVFVYKNKTVVLE